MKDIVAIRPLKAAYIYMQCPLCNVTNYIDKGATFFQDAKIRCEGCGANIEMELVALQDARFLINTDDLQDNEITAIFAKENTQEKITLEQDNLVISNPVQKISIEKSAYFYAYVCCPFCEEYSIVRYNQTIQPHVAQWCPECGAELVVTVIVKGVVSGEVSHWYQPRIEEFYRPGEGEK